MRDRFGQGIRMFVFAMAGTLVGQSAGFGLGAWQSNVIIKREGNIENITRVMRKVQQDLAEEMRQERGEVPSLGRALGIDTRQDQGQAMGHPPDGLERTGIPPSQRRKIQGMPSTPGSGPRSDGEYIDGENTRLARNFEDDPSRREQRLGGRASQDRAWGETAFAKDVSAEPRRTDEFGFPASEQQAAPASSGPPLTRRSRWEELRGQRSSEDSAWEKIRQDRARSDYAASQQRSGRNDQDASLFGERRPDSEGFSEEAQRRAEDERRRQMTKEKERQEYEKMFEKEARGEDSVYRQ